MNNKIINVMIIAIIIIGAIIIGTMGLRADLPYSKNTKLDFYLKTEFENNDVKQIAKEVFGTNKILVQKVEYYNDMVSILIGQTNIENLDDKKNELNTKINEKYGLENKVEDITDTEQPKIKLSSILEPFVMPISISIIIILAYACIRYRKVGVLNTLLKYIMYIFVPQALVLSVLAIVRIPIGRWITSLGLCVYIASLVVLTAKQEKEYTQIKEEERR